jgi:hypothetical protein
MVVTKLSLPTPVNVDLRFVLRCPLIVSERDAPAVESRPYPRY